MFKDCLPQSKIFFSDFWGHPFRQETNTEKSFGLFKHRFCSGFHFGIYHEDNRLRLSDLLQECLELFRCGHCRCKLKFYTFDRLNCKMNISFMDIQRVNIIKETSLRFILLIFFLQICKHFYRGMHKLKINFADKIYLRDRSLVLFFSYLSFSPNWQLYFNYIDFFQISILTAVESIEELNSVRI